MSCDDGHGNDDGDKQSKTIYKNKYISTLKKNCGVNSRREYNIRPQFPRRAFLLLTVDDDDDDDAQDLRP